ncbi:hypothetical protein AN965_18115, partial [Alkalicoccobacillus plakortidis]
MSDQYIFVNGVQIFKRTCTNGRENKWCYDQLLGGWTGATGLPGPTGPTGSTGVGFEGVEAFNADNTSGYMVGQIVTLDGNTYLVNTNSPTGVPGRSPDYTLLAEKGATGIQGERGETGATGIQGVQGETGATGIQGIQGETGATGIQG